MVWVKVLDVKESSLDGNSYLVYFDYYGKKCYSIISNRVTKFLNIEKVGVNDDIFVVKSFNKRGNPIYLLKDVKRI